MPLRSRRAAEVAVSWLGAGGRAPHGPSRTSQSALDTRHHSPTPPPTPALRPLRRLHAAETPTTMAGQIDNLAPSFAPFFGMVSAAQPPMTS